jgi:hypothetical protein
MFLEVESITGGQGQATKTYESEAGKTVLILEKSPLHLILGGLEDYLVVWNKRTPFFDKIDVM